MDLQMPEMNGLDAIIAIRGEFPDAKIIVLTTYKGDVTDSPRTQSGSAGLLAEKHDKSGWLLLGTVGAALAMLGPGLWSIDARLYGWKRLEAYTSQKI